MSLTKAMIEELSLLLKIDKKTQYGPTPTIMVVCPNDDVIVQGLDTSSKECIADWFNSITYSLEARSVFFEFCGERIDVDLTISLMSPCMIRFAVYERKVVENFRRKINGVFPVHTVCAAWLQCHLHTYVRENSNILRFGASLSK